MELESREPSYLVPDLENKLTIVDVDKASLAPASTVKQHDSMDYADVVTEEQRLSSVNKTALMRKVDLHVIPILFIICLANFLDR